MTSTRARQCMVRQALLLTACAAMLLPVMASAGPAPRPDRPWEQPRPARSWAARTAKPVGSSAQETDSTGSNSALNGKVAGTNLRVSQIVRWIDGTASFVELPEIYELAIETVKSIAGPSHPLLGYLHVRYARFLFLEDARQATPEYPPGDPRGRRATSAQPDRRARAMREAIEGERILRDAVRLDVRMLTDDDARRVALSRESALDLILTLAASRPAPAEIALAWDAYLRSRALVLDELAERQQAVASQSDTLLRNAAEALDRSRQRLSALSFAPLADDSRPAVELEQARSEVERFEQQVAKRSERYRRRVEERTVGLDDLSAQLDSGEALLGYAYYRDLTPEPDPSRVPAWRRKPVAAHDTLQVLAFVLPPGTRVPRVVSLGSALTIDEMAERWRQQMGRGAPLGHDRSIDLSANAAGDSLRRRIWDPVEPLVKSARRVYVVTDGALQLVNLLALPAASPPGAYVLETAPALAYLSTERDLARRLWGRAGAGLLAMGGVTFGPGASPDAQRGDASEPGASCSGLRALRFGELPSTAFEVEAIGDAWRRGRPSPDSACALFTGLSATESTFRTASIGRRALHVATHGFFLRDTCSADWRPAGVSLRASSMVLPPATAASPLLSSGIALARANDRDRMSASGDDGILTAEEIASLDLSAAQWVVLSACETALGETVPREGVLGLRRAFAVAGAGTVVSSLWQVDDEATRAFMKQLYDQRFTRGLAAPEAMRAAALGMLRLKRESGSSTLPGDWGAFLAVGSWSEPPAQKAR